MTGEPGGEATGVVALYRGGDREPYCTGTFVAQQFVVTAAHCLPPYQPFSDIVVRDTATGFEYYSGNPTPHPDWHGPEDVGFDIGVIEVYERPDLPPVPVARLPHRLLRSNPGVGQLQGYGLTRRADDGRQVLRTGCATIGELTRGTLEIEGGSAFTCNGDSGGPLFVELDGVRVLAGVHSRSNCESWSEDTRVDRHVWDFILPIIRSTELDFGCQDVVGQCDRDRYLFCYDGAVDEDCTSDRCAADGICDKSCVRDPDCGEEGECTGAPAGGCSASGAMAHPGWLAVLLLALVLRCRPRRRVDSPHGMGSCFLLGRARRRMARVLGGQWDADGDLRVGRCSGRH